MLKNCGLEQKYRNFNFFVHSSHLSLLLLFFVITHYYCHCIHVDWPVESATDRRTFSQLTRSPPNRALVLLSLDNTTSRQRHRRDADNSTSESGRQKPDEKR